MIGASIADGPGEADSRTRPLLLLNEEDLAAESERIEDGFRQLDIERERCYAMEADIQRRFWELADRRTRWRVARDYLRSIPAPPGSANR